MNLSKLSLLVCCVFFLHLSNIAQPFFKTKSYQFGIGATTLLGDLGGSLGAGTNTFKDFDDQSIGYTVCLASDWEMSKHFEFRTSLNYVFLKADDKYSEEITRKMRNLSVKTTVIEFMPSIKYYFTQANNKKTTLANRKKQMRMFTSIGLGLIYFNPRAEFNGKTYNLKSLRTEGQGLEGGAKTYSGFSAIVPFSLGFEHLIDNKSSLCYELTFRKSFTDYLDDVSTVYYENNQLAIADGTVAGELADRNLGSQKHGQGVTRGNPKSKDNYFTFTIGYKKLLTHYKAKRYKQKVFSHSSSY